MRYCFAVLKSPNRKHIDRVDLTEAVVVGLPIEEAEEPRVAGVDLRTTPIVGPIIQIYCSAYG